MDPVGLDGLWGGEVTRLALDFALQRVEMDVRVLDEGDVQRYRLMLDGVTEFISTNQVQVPWAYAELTEIHLREEPDGKVSVDVVMWSEPTGFHTKCARWRLVRMPDTAPRLVRLGFWRTDRQPDWPEPQDLVDVKWNVDEREVVMDYLRRGFVVRAYMGKSTCRFCSEDVGSVELSDGTYIWPEDLAHYVDTHGVRVPYRFVHHVQQRTAELEDAVVDDVLWRDVVES